jgi:hypothetical protein
VTEETEKWHTRRQQIIYHLKYKIKTESLVVVMLFPHLCLSECGVMIIMLASTHRAVSRVVVHSIRSDP